MWYGETRVKSYELGVTSYELRVQSLKARVEGLNAQIKIQKCEFKPWVTISNSQVTG